MTPVTAKDELIQHLLALIRQLNEDQLVNIFEQEMTEDGYLSNQIQPTYDESAHEWLKDWIGRSDISVGLLENLLSDIQCKIDYPDS